MRLPFFRKNVKKKQFTIAFYNVENLFDTEFNTATLDRDFTPLGAQQWTVDKYRKKLTKLSNTISAIGDVEHRYPPVLVGLAEVENSTVLAALLDTGPLKDLDYGFMHFDSPDERGIDTGLLYRKRLFEVIDAEPIALMVDNPGGVRDRTRDILYVKGILNGETVHVFVNHWPSRRDGGVETEYKRMRAAQLIIERITLLKATEVDCNIIVMGDFNDDPSSKSMQLLTTEAGLFNPMET
ncbi:MAG: endonuclease/exonuclease/phosphatase family protein, partial [Maribacter sp.]